MAMQDGIQMSNLDQTPLTSKPQTSPQPDYSMYMEDGLDWDLIAALEESRALEKASLQRKGVTQENWLQHLDELTDEEITSLLDREPNRGQLDEEREARPDISDRTRAEFLRDF